MNKMVHISCISMHMMHATWLTFLHFLLHVLNRYNWYLPHYLILKILCNVIVCNIQMYSETCLERPLPLETTCLKRPHISGRKFYISIQLNLWPKTTCLERKHFYVGRGGLSRQALLYHVYIPGTPPLFCIFLTDEIFSFLVFNMFK